MTTPNLSMLIEHAAAGTDIRVPPGEHRLNAVIRQPVRLSGRGPVSHLQGTAGTTATITVLAPDVVLENLSLEHLDGIALFCGPGIRPTLRNVTVRGGVEFADVDLDGRVKGSQEGFEQAPLHVFTVIADVLHVLQSRQSWPMIEGVPAVSLRAYQSEMRKTLANDSSKQSMFRDALAPPRAPTRQDYARLARTAGILAPPPYRMIDTERYMLIDWNSVERFRSK